MKKSGFVYILLTALLFATFEPFAANITGTHPLTITFLRFFIGSLILLPFSLIKLRRTGIKLKIADYGQMTLLGVLVICVSMLLLQYAISSAKSTGGSTAAVAIVFSTNSIFTILLSALILKDKLTIKKIVAVGLCLTGILICSDFSSGANIASILLATGSALSFSLYTVLSKKLMKKVSGTVQTGISFFAGSIVLFIALLFMQFIMKKDMVFLGAFSTVNLPWLIWICIAVTGVGYYCFFRALEYSGAAGASLVFFIKPVLTPFVALAVSLLYSGQEANTNWWRVGIALILVLAGSFLVSVKKKKTV